MKIGTIIILKGRCGLPDEKVVFLGREVIPCSFGPDLWYRVKWLDGTRPVLVHSSDVRK